VQRKSFSIQLFKPEKWISAVAAVPDGIDDRRDERLKAIFRGAFPLKLLQKQTGAGPSRGPFRLQIGGCNDPRI
jgi:hypothetical protein